MPFPVNLLAGMESLSTTFSRSAAPLWTCNTVEATAQGITFTLWCLCVRGLIQTREFMHSLWFCFVPHTQCSRNFVSLNLMDVVEYFTAFEISRHSLVQQPLRIVSVPIFSKLCSLFHRLQSNSLPSYSLVCAKAGSMHISKHWWRLENLWSRTLKNTRQISCFACH